LNEKIIIYLNILRAVTIAVFYRHILCR